MWSRAWKKYTAAGIFALWLSVAVAVAAVEQTPRTVTGPFLLVSSNTVSVGGYRLRVTSASTVLSDGRPVSPAAIEPGTVVTAEMDDAGRLIHLETKGVVE